MHELSITRSILQLAERFRPPGARVRCVQIQAGPLRGIDAGALSWAWQATVPGTPYAEAALDYEPLPWRMRCRECARRQSVAVDKDPWQRRCPCGGAQWELLDGDVLLLVALEVADDGQELASPSSGAGVAMYAPVDHSGTTVSAESAACAESAAGKRPAESAESAAVHGPAECNGPPRVPDPSGQLRSTSFGGVR